MKLQNIIIGAIAVVALGVGIVSLNSHASVPAPSVSSVTGPDSFFQTETHNGISYQFNRKPLSVGTTTSCAFKTPSATSTLNEASIFVKSHPSGIAESVNITTGTAMQASTTALSSTFSVAAGAQAVVMASSTNSEAIRTFSPNTWIQFNVFGGSGTASSTGTCEAEFQNL